MIFKNTFTTTQQGFLICTCPHRVCHQHHKLFSSALERTVTQVEKHCSTDIVGILLMNFCLFCYDFWTRNARKSIKPS